MIRGSRSLVVAGLALFAAACGSDPVRQKPGASHPPPTNVESGTFSIEVSATARTFVNLATREVVTPDDAKDSKNWDLAFVGYDVLTNGGISGSAAGAAFGPLDISVFAFPDDPVDVPFWITDTPGGVFLRWYAYDGADHTLYSRYHVYGLRSGERLYKLQVLGYYGDVQGAPVSALYQVRYAEVTADGSGETQEIHDIDGTVGGKDASPDLPSGCLTLATGETKLLTPNQAKRSRDWDVCFQREAIGVNGDLGGPGGVTGVDLQALDLDDETIAEVKKRTAETEQALFDGVDEATLTSPDVEFRGDGVTTAFTGKWANLASEPPAPKLATAFIVRTADGRSRYLVTFDSFEGASSDTPGTVTLTVQTSPSP